MRCPYCGSSETRPGFFRAANPGPKACSRCAPLLKPLFTSGRGLFSEKPIRQNRGDLRRKLLESDTLHFIIFLDETGAIAGFELTDRDERHLLDWRLGRPARYYAVRNEGRGYANHDRILANGPFPADRFLRDLDATAANLHAPVRSILREAILSGAGR